MTALDQLLLAHRRKAEAPAWGLLAALVWENLPGNQDSRKANACRCVNPLSRRCRAPRWL